MKRESFQNLIQAVGRHSGQAARDLLYQARAEDPSHFVLQLVAAAVACRSSRIQVRNDELDLVVECNGTAPPPTAIADMYGSFEATSKDERTRYLSLGLNSAFATGIGQLELETWDGRQGIRLILTPSSQSHQLLKVDPFQGQGWSLRVRCLQRSKFMSLARAVNQLSKANGPPECQAVRERCAWAGPEVIVDRFPVNEEVAPGRVLMWAWLQPEQPMPHVEFRFARPRLGSELQDVPKVPFYALVSIGALSFDWTGVRAVVNGVTLPPGLPLSFRDVSVVLSAPDLEPDVNFTGLRTNSTLETILEILTAVSARMAREMLDRRENIGFDQAELASRIFEDLSQYYHRNNQQEASLHALGACLELREQVLGATHPDLVDGWTQLLDINRKIGNAEAVRPIQQRLIPLLRASGENHLRKHRVGDATALLKRALEMEEQLPEPPANLAQSYHELAVLVKEHRLPGSEELFQKALSLQQGAPNASPESTLKSFYELADRHRANRRLAEAEIQARKALELAEQVHGRESKELVPFLKLLAEILKAANRYSDATDFESRAMTLRFKR
ncbi:tetratricopeptide repeat-containing protein [bacterium]|nr:tetratricopeptide repeat-containing protein [bacterium]